jgi:hypothetical protein
MAFHFGFTRAVSSAVPPANMIRIGDSTSAYGLSPTGVPNSALLSFWTKRVGAADSIYAASLFDSSNHEFSLSLGWSNGHMTANLQAWGSGESVTSFDDTLASGEENGFVWIAVQFIYTSATSLTCNLWRKYGMAGSISGPVSATVDPSSWFSWSGVDHLFFGPYDTTGVMDMELVACRSQSTTPNLATLNNIALATAPIGGEWGWWKFNYDSSPVFTDSSGNGKTLTSSGTLAQGAQGPF